MDEAAVKIEYSPSANIQLDYANKSALAGILALEFGYRDSFSAMVSRLCCNYARLYNCTTDSAMHVGAGFGRGPMEFSKLFKSVGYVSFKYNEKDFPESKHYINNIFIANCGTARMYVIPRYLAVQSVTPADKS